MVRPKVTIVHSRLGGGGSEAGALWALDALKDEYGVSLITDGGVDLTRLNECYGTKLERSRAVHRFSVEHFQRGLRGAVAEFLLEKQFGGEVSIHAEAHA